jgi:predicted unusual protein kinase regulating ubiquinone biosynthesis (AarF/ABC1/UbiB family)
VTEQGQITSSRAGRIAALAGTGALVGINYLKHYGRRMVTGETGKEALHLSNATAVYKTFSELKGGPLKLAQMLSINKNVLPRAYSDQFAMAQHSVPPLSYPLVVKTFRREFGRGPSELFDTFEQKAAHGASIGQVHRATRRGHSYAVKVQYPGVAKSLRSDLRVIKPIALQMLGLKENDVRDYFREVEQKLLEETDYTLELKNAEMLYQHPLASIIFDSQGITRACPAPTSLPWIGWMA